MRKLLTASAAALALAGVTIGAAAPAEARYYGRGYYGHRGGHSGAILGAGILGLAAGAAIASNHPRYYSPGYYGYGAPVYYAPPPPPPVYYDGYYDRGPICRSDWRWDGYIGRYVRVRYCD